MGTWGIVRTYLKVFSPLGSTAPTSTASNISFRTFSVCPSAFLQTLFSTSSQVFLMILLVLFSTWGVEGWIISLCGEIYDFTLILIAAFSPQTNPVFSMFTFRLIGPWAKQPQPTLIWSCSSTVSSVSEINQSKSFHPAEKIYLLSRSSPSLHWRKAPAIPPRRSPRGCRPCTWACRRRRLRGPRSCCGRPRGGRTQICTF